MKTREQKQKDLEKLTEKFKTAGAAVLVGFHKMSVAKDQELREQLRQAGVSYAVVKNTIAKIAAKGTPLEQAADQFTGVTAVALTDSDPVGISKAISKFSKANPENFTFKIGIVEGKVVQLGDIEAIAALPSKEELISKIMFLINSQAQRIAIVTNVIARNLAVVVDQVRAQKEAQPS